jgi:hypothetical protein
LTKLESLRNGLIKGNIENCRLAKDFDRPPKNEDEPIEEYYLRKSEYWISYADIFLLVFYDGTDNASVGIELKTILSNPGNAWRTILAYEENVSSLVVGLGLRYQPEISVISFSNDSDLLRQSVGNIRRYLGRLYFEILQRPLGEWEGSSIF